jgi:hypothetical protein
MKRLSNAKNKPGTPSSLHIVEVKNRSITPSMGIERPLAGSPPGLACMVPHAKLSGQLESSIIKHPKARVLLFNEKDQENVCSPKPP